MDEVNEVVELGLGEVEALGLPAPAEFAIAMVLVLIATVIVHLVMDRFLIRLAARTSLGFDDKLVACVHRPIVAIVLLFGTARALELLELTPDRLLLLQRSLYTILTVYVALGAARLVRVVIDGYMDDVADVTGLRSEMGPFLRNLSNIGILALWAGWVLVIWDQSVAPILASLGVAGLAVSLAAKDALANIFGGVSIFLEGTYSLGDYLELPDVPGIGRGEVVGIGLRSTRLATRDDIVVTIPNALMANSAIVNQSSARRYRARISFGVAYGTKLERVEKIALDLANGHPLVLEAPEPRLRLRELGDSAVQYELLCWCDDPARRGKLMHQLYTQIHDSFSAEGINIPFPQLDVRLLPEDQAAAEGEV